MIIQKIHISEINPAPYNPRKDLRPGDKEYEKLRRSIELFDMVEPLVWNKRTRNLVGGHQRLKILQELNHTDVDVSVVDLDEKNERALNVALNKISGDWDLDKLKGLLTSLESEGYDLTLTGFDDLELKELLDYQGKAGLTDADAAPEKPKTAISQKGDLYVLGEHRLICGDATNITDLQNLMGGGLRGDMVFTDPPYNVDYEGYTADELKIQNDKMSPEKFKEFLALTFDAYHLVLKEGASLYVCHPHLYQREFQNALEAKGFEIRAQIIWAKNTFAWGFGRYKYQHEPIFYCHLKGKSDAWYGDRKQSTLWQERKPAANRLHPTMKPVELVIRAIINSSKAGDVVVDLFGGSGSTMIACEKMGRRSFTMELDPAYCDVIVKRWEDFTGRKAVRQEAALADHL